MKAPKSGSHLALTGQLTLFVTLGLEQTAIQLRSILMLQDTLLAPFKRLPSTNNCSLITHLKLGLSGPVLLLLSQLVKCLVNSHLTQLIIP